MDEEMDVAAVLEMLPQKGSIYVEGSDTDDWRGSFLSHKSNSQLVQIERARSLQDLLGQICDQINIRVV